MPSVTHGTSDVAGLALPARSKIQLSWGATLYSTDKFVSRPHPEENPWHLTKEQSWALLSVSCMTSMVVTLHSLRVLGDLCLNYYSAWDIGHLSQLLNTIEACYHHARSFNNDYQLRQNLKQRSFMKFRDNSTRLPHLLEQETLSVSKILTFVFRLCSEEGDGGLANARAAFAEPWLRR